MAGKSRSVSKRRSYWYIILFIICTICQVLSPNIEVPLLSTSDEDTNQIVYNKFQLQSINRNCNKDQRLRWIPAEVVVKIRKLKIQKKRKRGRRGGVTRGNKQWLSRTSDISNIITVAPNKLNSMKEIHFGLLNARSIKTKSDFIELLLTQNNIHFCVITETWLNEKENTKIFLQATRLNNDPWKLLSANRSYSKGGGLALVYNINYLNVIEIESKCTKEIEYCIWKLHGKSTEFIVVGIYHSPTNANNINFCDNFANLVAEVTAKYKNILYFGDFNIHVNNKMAYDSEQFNEMIDALGLINHVHFSTHQSGNILDLILSECFSSINVHQVIPDLFLSDHCLVKGSLNIKPIKNKIDLRSCRSFKNVDIEEMLNDMDLSNIQRISEIEDISAEDRLNIMVNSFDCQSNYVLNKFAPIKEFKKKVTKRHPWFNDKLLQLRSDLRKLLSKWTHSRNNILWENYKRLRTKYWYELDKAKVSYLNTEIESHKGNSKYLFQLVTDLTGNIIENKMPHTDEDETPLEEKFADFFINKIQTIRNDLEDFPLFDATKIERNYDTSELIQFDEVSTPDVLNEINKLECKSCELDSMPTKFIKSHTDIFLESITTIINMSLQSGIFPESWKTAILRPLHKKSTLPLELKNYRPVSNLSFLSKVLERVGMSQILKHCEMNNLQSAHQSAYKKYHSCETQLIKLVNDILLGMENKLITPVIFLDLSAAFDTVDHKILLNVLEHCFKISGKALDWVKSYLTDRKFKVCIDQRYSKDKILNFSVSQGSCNGPVYFNFYSSTITEIIPTNVDISAFADDHEVHKSCKLSQIQEVLLLLEKVTTSINNWMKANRLKMNASKTEFMVFGSRKILDKCDIQSTTVAGEVIKNSSLLRYLGALLNPSLTMSEFVNKKCQTALWNIQKIKQIRKFLTIDSLKIVVDALVTSHLDYANGILFGIPEKYINKLQRIQSIAAKLILGRKKHDSLTDCLKTLHWLPIKARLDFKILLMVYNCSKGHAPEYLIDLLKPCDDTNTRNSKKHYQLKVPSISKQTFAARSFSFAGPSLWNKLPNNIRQINSNDAFKKALKAYLFDQYLCNSSDYIYY